MASRARRPVGRLLLDLFVGREAADKLLRLSRADEDLSRIRQTIEDIKASQGEKPGAKSVERAVVTAQRPLPALISYQRPSTSGRGIERKPNLHYQQAQYDLTEIARVRDIESMFQTSIERHVEMAMQEGWSLQGDDPGAVDRCRQRLWEMTVLSQKTTEEFLRQVLDQVATYGTAIVVAKRDSSRSSGRKIRLFGKTVDPIAFLDIADAPTMTVAENSGGNPAGWLQTIQEDGGNVERREFHPFDVFVMARHRQPGRVFGRPMVLSVLDDIVALRKLEELADVLPQKYVFPLFQLTVGTPDHPAGFVRLPDGTQVSEIELAQDLIDKLPTEGGFATPERYKIELIGAKNQVLDLMPYISHFYGRVLQGLRLNPTIMGGNRGGESTKGTSTNEMKALSDSVRAIQRVVEDGMYLILLQVLMEEGFDVTSDNAVRLVFARPDTEEKRAEEVHSLEQFQGGVIDHNEMRQKMGRPPFKEGQEEGTFQAKQHKREKELSRLKAKMGTPGPAEAKGKKKAEASARLIEVKSRPRNQYGAKATKTRSRANDDDPVLASWRKLAAGRASAEALEDVLLALREDLIPVVESFLEDLRRETEDPSIFLEGSSLQTLLDEITRADVTRLVGDCLRSSGETCPASLVFEAAIPLLNLARERFSSRIGELLGERFVKDEPKAG